MCNAINLMCTWCSIRVMSVINLIYLIYLIYPYTHIPIYLIYLINLIYPYTSYTSLTSPSDDDTYLEDEQLRELYCLEDTGVVWRGTEDNPSPRLWLHGQVYRTIYPIPLSLCLSLSLSLSFFLTLYTVRISLSGCSNDAA